ncbi:unnamed protein product [Malus baccata var. baccata]
MCKYHLNQKPSLISSLSKFWYGCFSCILLPWKRIQLLCSIFSVFAASFRCFVSAHSSHSFTGTITIYSPCYQINNLLAFPSAWNQLAFSSMPRSRLRKIALFGMDRHALTLHLALANRGHELHIFTTPNSSFPSYPTPNLYFHLSKPTAMFQSQNPTVRPFDVIYTESVGLLHTLASKQTNLAVSWHGIAYKTVVEEVRIFPSYAHHVATSDHVGDVLKRIYMIPDDRFHIILNGVDEEVFKRDIALRKDFRRKFGVLESKTRHPLMFEALKQILKENDAFRQTVVVLVAGNGPWGIASYIVVNNALREASNGNKACQHYRLCRCWQRTVASLKKILYRVWSDGRGDLKQKGQAARQRGLQLFTAKKMVAAYERLFLCISNDEKIGENYCQFQIP